MLKRHRRLGEAGSGMVIGVAIMFPMLVVVIMVLQVVADSSRIEQALQATANRTARTASLCCHNTGDQNGAEAVAKASLQAAQADNAYNRVRCNNDLADDSDVVFQDVDGGIVTPDPDTAVPPGGTVHVFLTCAVPPQLLGGFVLPLFDTKRTVVGTATIDPFRHRTAT
ncbi:MAG: hypothetical protein F4Z34_04285 [Acidimicrobiaceae bacterium]|nr:hypothetical protein [Acidimicrobiaceae bacterium]